MNGVSKSFPALSDNVKRLFNSSLQRIETVNIDSDIANILSISDLRKNSKLKLPDAIIADCAVQNQLTLITNDKHFAKVENLSLLNF